MRSVVGCGRGTALARQWHSTTRCGHLLTIAHYLSPTVLYCRHQQTMMEHYELSLIDYLRFLVGWGMWGNTAWLTKRVGRLLKSWGPHLAAS